MTQQGHRLHADPIELIERRLPSFVTHSPGGAAGGLHGAMDYALMAPGKRLRPRLVLAIAGHSPAAVDVACAVEMVHTASLILDDLPSMDNAALRRGQATTHRRFGEATAILAAIALISGAFEAIAQADLPSDMRAQLAAILAGSIGRNGMCAGQALDLALAAETAADAQDVNALKTATLFVSAARMGAILRQLTPAEVEAAAAFAEHLGHAFQLADDALDAAPDPSVTGKDVQADTGKPTVAHLTDAGTVRQMRHHHIAEAQAALRRAGLDPAAIAPLFSGLQGQPQR